MESLYERGKTPFWPCFMSLTEIFIGHETFDNDVLFLWTDIALKILENDNALATARDEKTIAALCELAKKPFAIGNNSQISLWKRCFNFC